MTENVLNSFKHQNRKKALCSQISNVYLVLCLVRKKTESLQSLMQAILGIESPYDLENNEIAIEEMID